MEWEEREGKNNTILEKERKKKENPFPTNSNSLDSKWTHAFFALKQKSSPFCLSKRGREREREYFYQPKVFCSSPFPIAYYSIQAYLDYVTQYEALNIGLFVVSNPSPSLKRFLTQVTWCKRVLKCARVSPSWVGHGREARSKLHIPSPLSIHAKYLPT